MANYCSTNDWIEKKEKKMYSQARKSSYIFDQWFQIEFDFEFKMHKKQAIPLKI